MGNLNNNRLKISKRDMHLLTGVRTGKNLHKVNILKARLRRDSQELKQLQLTNIIENYCSSFGEYTTLSQGGPKKNKKMKKVNITAIFQ